jgi:protein-tyrosine phosphatase
MTRSKFFLPVALVSLTMAPCGQAFPADLEQLTGAANFRDIGGYRTADGRTIKSHVVYRSGELSGLTVSDRHVLSSLRIRYEIDLRTGKEREEAPSQWGENAPEVIAIPVGESRNSSPAASTAMGFAGLKTAEEAQRYLQQATVRIATQGAADIGEVIRRLAQGAEPALIHCTAGKDRTGVTVAVLMTVLGAPRDAVEREYMRSSEAIEQQLERMKARERTGTASGFLSLQPEVLQTLLSTKPDYVEAVFRAIDEQYGSFDAYTRSGLKLSASQTQALRARLLEP